MSTLFGNLSTDGLEEATDRLGGGFGPLDTDIYVMKIKAMYAGQSDGGARSVTLIGDNGGKEYRETFWITNKKGQNFFMAKDKQGNETGKKSPMMGFTIVDDICQITTGKPLSEQETEDKVVQVWEDGKQVNKNVPMLVETLGQEVALGIIRRRVNKNAKDESGNYVPTAEEREENGTDKVFHPELKLTIVEAKAGGDNPEPVFWDAWLVLNKGKTQDRRKIKDGQGGAAGAPQAARAASAAPAAGASAAPKKSLFGKK
ncbi:hypothetical protein [Caballeronia sp. LZ034LL]|uniref:hypothetical protein n=1 Tax=Caballeronia sp. LZ034LL TaxID=3038567 RepID=UPI00285B97F5|nr:hypothetical protein [Caballeronia sp. LZ034LL]MDR5839309.1 hypothetical protein [Caballeronia sp. LZ034LL]